MDSTSLAISQLTLGAVASWLLQKLKGASWFPFLTEESSKVTKIIVSALTSLAAVTGLSYTYDATAHTLLIANFSLPMVATASWHWLTQFVMQEGWYQAIFNKPVVAAVASGPVPVVAQKK